MTEITECKGYAWCIIGDYMHVRHNGMWVQWRIWKG